MEKIWVLENLNLFQRLNSFVRPLEKKKGLLFPFFTVFVLCIRILLLKLGLKINLYKLIKMIKINATVIFRVTPCIFSESFYLTSVLRSITKYWNALNEPNLE